MCVLWEAHAELVLTACEGYEGAACEGWRGSRGQGEPPGHNAGLTPGQREGEGRRVGWRSLGGQYPSVTASAETAQL